MRIKKLDERVELLRETVRFSLRNSYLDWLPHWEDFLAIDEYAFDPILLAYYTALCQIDIKLPIYTVAHAAAWLGLSKRGVVEAYRAGRLPYIQPGREVLFTHESLVEFAKERRYEL